MKLRLNNTPGILPVLLIASALVGLPAFAEETLAAPGSGMAAGMGGGMVRGGMQGKGKQGNCKHSGGHRRHCMHEKKHGHKACGKHRDDSAWRDSLSPEQELQIDQVHVNFAKTKAPLKARIKALKVDLAVLATAPQPNKAVIDAKIKELLELKGQLLGAKYGYIAAQRQVLSPQQQVSFDMDVVRKAMHGKKDQGSQCGRH